MIWDDHDAPVDWVNVVSLFAVTLFCFAVWTLFVWGALELLERTAGL